MYFPNKWKVERIMNWSKMNRFAYFVRILALLDNTNNYKYMEVYIFFIYRKLHAFRYNNHICLFILKETIVFAYICKINFKILRENQVAIDFYFIFLINLFYFMRKKRSKSSMVLPYN